MDQIKWGIIGCGDVTERKSGPAFSKIANSQLVAVMRRDAEKAADYARRHGVPAWYADAEALIQDPEVNAIYVATPPDTHARYAIRAMQAGKPVYVEKPMALHTAECEAMNQVSRETGVPLFVAYYRRALPYFVKVRELLEADVIGAVRYVQIQLNREATSAELSQQASWRVSPEISGGGHFHDLASHQFDFLQYLLGPITKAQGLSRNQAKLYPADDLVVATFEFETDVLGAGSWCFTVNKEQRRDETQLIGAKGRITFSSFDFSPILIDTQTGREEMDVPFPEHVQQPLIESVVRYLRGEGTCPSTGATAIQTSKVLDWITSPK